ncbi:hypothetical protein TWF694_001622 [Orbilia ellipsospora]|uniref:Nucleoporin NDC1 n=1 Tax=Orbilia ellipsospora TaxID=2528407 RepID=A0AAV9X494_9PEZI
MGSQILKTKATGARTKPNAPNYHALVTPVLHRRFVRASWTTLTIAYIGNIIMENISGWPWSIFPLGRAGINTLILFVFLIPILILRIAQLSTTSKKNLSDVHCLLHSLTDRSLIKCVFWYTLSAWLIVQFYLWNTRASSDLSIVTKTISYETYRLNERPLYLLSCALPLGLIQGLIHVWVDRDYLKLQKQEQTVWQALSNSIIKSIQRVGTSIILSVASTPIFYIIFRPVICRVSHSLVGSIIKLNPDNQPQTLSNRFDLLFRSLWLSMLIIIAWEATNISFTVEFEKSPIREGKTISEISPDPNGSLLLGLRLKKKPFSRLLAFRELSFIATEMPQRRDSIFKELTKPIPTLKLILTECREIVGVIATNLSPPPEATTGTSDVKNPSPVKEIKGFSPQKPSDENILRTPAKKSVVEQWQATPGNMPTSPINLDAIKTHMIKRETVETKMYSLLNPILKSQYGDVFRITIQRKTTNLLPCASMQIDALNAMVGFIYASLKEDTYGMVQKDLAEILEELTRVSSALECYIANPPLHWTDIHAKKILESGSASAREALFPEAVLLLATVDDGLQKIGEAFNPYFDVMGLSTDVRRKIRRVCEEAKRKSK